MPEDKKEPMIDVGEEEGAEINLDQTNEQAKETENDKIEVVEDSKSDDTHEKSDEQSTIQASSEEKKSEKDDELEKYSEGVQKRIAKLTRKMREAERQKEEAIAYAHTEKQKREEYEKRYSSLDANYVNEFESRVKTNLAAAKLALKTAIEAQDVEAQIAAQEQIANISVDAARLKTLKSESETKQKQVNITPQQYETVNTYNGREIPNSVPTDEKAEVWATRNTWFGNDSAMTYTAFDIHKKLVEEEGFDPKSDEYYTEIDKRIRLEFPHKFGKMEGNTTERAKPAQTVASAKRPSTTGRRRTVKLTPSQVAIAKRLGVPLEEYAKQLTTKEA
jgi:hypothetical protein